MFGRFAQDAQSAVARAQEEARERGHDRVGTEHLLLAVLHDPGQPATQVLAALGIPADVLRGIVEELVPRREGPSVGRLAFTPRAKKVLELSLREALRLGGNHIGGEHLLLALVREGEGVAAQALARAGADPHKMAERVAAVARPEQEPRRPRLRDRLPWSPSSGARRGEEVSGNVETNPWPWFDDLSDQGVLALVEARREARRLGSPVVAPEHLVVGALALHGGATQAMADAGLRLEGLRAALEAAAVDVQPSPESPSLGDDVRAILLVARAGRAAGAAELLKAALEQSSAARLAVTAAGGDLDALRRGHPWEA